MPLKFGEFKKNDQVCVNCNRRRGRHYMRDDAPLSGAGMLGCKSMASNTQTTWFVWAGQFRSSSGENTGHILANGNNDPNAAFVRKKHE